MQPGNKSGQNCKREKLIPTWQQSARASTTERGGVSSGHFPLPRPGSGNTKPDQCHSRDWGIQTAQHPGLSAHLALTRAALGSRDAPFTAAATQPGLGLSPAGLPAALLHLHARARASPRPLCPGLPTPSLLDDASPTAPRTRETQPRAGGEAAGSIFQTSDRPAPPPSPGPVRLLPRPRPARLRLPSRPLPRLSQHSGASIRAAGGAG